MARLTAPGEPPGFKRRDFPHNAHTAIVKQNTQRLKDKKSMDGGALWKKARLAGPAFPPEHKSAKSWPKPVADNGVTGD